MHAPLKKPWFRNLLDHHRKPNFQTTTAKAQEGDAEAQFHLGLILSDRAGDAQDQAQAVQWFLKAAHLNHSLAQFNLGLMYAAGRGVTRDDGEAITWIRKAAEHGNPDAQFDLGSRYHRSSLSGLEMDLMESRIESFKWFQLAANQGHQLARAACERITLAMSFDEVAEGDHRVAAFRSPIAKLTQDDKG